MSVVPLQESSFRVRFHLILGPGRRGDSSHESHVSPRRPPTSRSTLLLGRTHSCLPHAHKHPWSFVPSHCRRPLLRNPCPSPGKERRHVRLSYTVKGSIFPQTYEYVTKCVCTRFWVVYVFLVLPCVYVCVDGNTRVEGRSVERGRRTLCPPTPFVCPVPVSLPTRLSLFLCPSLSLCLAYSSRVRDPTRTSLVGEIRPGPRRPSLSRVLLSAVQRWESDR